MKLKPSVILSVACLSFGVLAACGGQTEETTGSSSVPPASSGSSASLSSDQLCAFFDDALRDDLLANSLNPYGGEARDVTLTTTPLGEQERSQLLEEQKEGFGSLGIEVGEEVEMLGACTAKLSMQTGGGESEGAASVDYILTSEKWDSKISSLATPSEFFRVEQIDIPGADEAVLLWASLLGGPERPLIISARAGEQTFSFQEGSGSISGSFSGSPTGLSAEELQQRGQAAALQYAETLKATMAEVVAQASGSAIQDPPQQNSVPPRDPFAE